MDDNLDIEIRYNTLTLADSISEEELVLIESIMSELMLTMMQDHQSDSE